MDGGNTRRSSNHQSRDAMGLRRVFIFINGINTLAGNATAWTDRAVTWTHLNTDARGEKFEYTTGAILRRIGQNARAEAVARMIDYYARSVDARWEIHLVGHSNGCDVITRTVAYLLDRSMAHVKTVHLIAGACDADLNQNGLNAALDYDVVEQVRVYTGGHDLALRLAKGSRTFLKWVRLGYGSLGIEGPKNCIAWLNEGRVLHFHEPEFGHSTWLSGERFTDTMMLVTCVTAKRADATDFKQEAAEVRRDGWERIEPAETESDFTEDREGREGASAQPNARTPEKRQGTAALHIAGDGSAEVSA